VVRKRGIVHVGDIESSDGEGAFRWWVWWGDGMGMQGNRAAAVVVVVVKVKVVPEGGGRRKLQSVVLALWGDCIGRTTSPERGIWETGGGVGRRET